MKTNLGSRSVSDYNNNNKHIPVSRLRRSKPIIVNSDNYNQNFTIPTANLKDQAKDVKNNSSLSILSGTSKLFRPSNLFGFIPRPKLHNAKSENFKFGNLQNFRNDLTDAHQGRKVSNSNANSKGSKNIRRNGIVATSSFDFDRYQKFGDFLESQRYDGDGGERNQNDSIVSDDTFGDETLDRSEFNRIAALLSSYESYAETSTDIETAQRNSPDHDKLFLNNISHLSESSADSMKFDLDSTSNPASPGFLRLRSIFDKLDGTLSLFTQNCKSMDCKQSMLNEKTGDKICGNCQVLNAQKAEITSMIVKEVAFDVQRIAASSRTLSPSKRRSFTIFESETICPLALPDFLLRLVKYIEIWFEDANEVFSEHVGIHCLFMTVFYICRLQDEIGLVYSQWNLHNVLLTCFLIAAKYTEDETISNKWWAKVGDVDVEKLNEMELEFCKLLEFRLFVDDEVLASMYGRYVPEIIS